MTTIHDGVMAWAAPGLTPALRQRLIAGAQCAGDLAGSAGLQGADSRYTHMPFFPGLSHIARSAFVDGTIDIPRIAAALVALGLLASALLVRRTDLQQEQDGARPVAAA
jgi:hypothetical protein